jgi:hypothetical protein
MSVNIMRMLLYFYALCLQFWKYERSFHKVVYIDITVRVTDKVSLNVLGQLSSRKETAETTKHSNNYLFLEMLIFSTE